MFKKANVLYESQDIRLEIRGEGGGGKRFEASTRDNSSHKNCIYVVSKYSGTLRH